MIELLKEIGKMAGVSLVVSLIVVALVGGNNQPNTGGSTRFPNSDLSAASITSNGAFTSTGAATLSSTATVTGDLTVNTNDFIVDVSADVAGVGTSTPSGNAEFIVANKASSGTSTLMIYSADGGKGGCIQMEGQNTSEATTTYKVFVNAAGTLTTEAGTCKE